MARTQVVNSWATLWRQEMWWEERRGGFHHGCATMLSQPGISALRAGYSFIHHKRCKVAAPYLHVSCGLLTCALHHWSCREFLSEIAVIPPQPCRHKRNSCPTPISIYNCRYFLAGKISSQQWKAERIHHPIVTDKYTFVFQIAGETGRVELHPQ